MKRGLKVLTGTVAVMISAFVTPYVTDNSTLQFGTPVLLGVMTGALIMASERYP